MDGDAAAIATAVNNAPPTNVVAANLTSTIVSVPLTWFAKPFLDISKIKVFDGENFTRWQERIFSDMHGVEWVLTDFKTDTNAEAWTYGNKVCRYSIISCLIFTIAIKK